jgi:hypothetical protein
MLHRFPAMRAYMGHQWVALLTEINNLKRRIRESIEDDEVFANIRESMTAPDLSHFAITATRATP